MTSPTTSSAATNPATATNPDPSTTAPLEETPGATREASLEETLGEVTAFLTAALRQDIAPEDDYFALGLADSLFALELVTFVEERFGLSVEVEDLDLDSFRTAAAVAAFVGRKTGRP
ncbi:acyl carrier protein [Streptomyces sp. MST-110588]|uniref:acyl carrier protein n=1 Tax=Streptomyces sp. MST-110588 TaxID=2833628 RepID=UPI001F5CBC4C|nr:acyl carrier protein [Streptomyces sp. MST-110588]UNO38533.1 acyl carrier protein [Streptomyces sp. MST-110588]